MTTGIDHIYLLLVLIGTDKGGYVLGGEIGKVGRNDHRPMSRNEMHTADRRVQASGIANLNELQ